MLYLIKSPKWTEYYKKDTFWAPNQCGYVSVIAHAGFYCEEEAHDIMKRSGSNGAELVPVTKEIMDKAYLQLRGIRKKILENVEIEEARHIAILDDLNKKQVENDNYFDTLEQLSKELEL